jgi:hypothetical protein
MMKDQVLPAFIAQLIAEGVEAKQIEQAVSGVRSIRLGESITGDDPLRRAFAFEQADLLKRAAK